MQISRCTSTSGNLRTMTSTRESADMIETHKFCFHFYFLRIVSAQPQVGAVCEIVFPYSVVSVQVFPKCISVLI